MFTKISAGLLKRSIRHKHFNHFWDKNDGMRADINFVHAPSIFDFRKRNLKEGPLSDVIPSTPLFEMYPVGFVSMLGYAIRNGYRARISNIAVLMLSDRNFDVDRYIKSLDSEIFGIDLHWLPHVHGAFNVARLIRKYHPNSKILLGGFSSSYFATDIMESNQDIDFILAGDFVEKQLIRLLEANERGTPLEEVPNLVFRKEGRIITNPRLKDPDPGDAVYLDYSVLFKNAFKYHDIKGHLPYYSWIQNPTGMTVIQRGCQLNCGFCGGSNFAYRNNYFSSSPVRRAPQRVAEEMEVIRDTISSPIFLAGDVRMAGEKYYTELFSEIRNRGLDLPLLTEYFEPPTESYLEMLSRYVSEYSCEISPESSNEAIRRRAGKHYSNAELEKSIENASRLGSKKFDVYYSIGLPEQTVDRVLEDCSYMEKMMYRFRNKEMAVHGFIAPLAPFIDPGSLFYEKSEQFGYRIKARKIMDYYDLLDRGISWEDFLNYETKWMSKEDIVRATYQSGLREAEIGNKLGFITSNEKNEIQTNIMGYMNGLPYTPKDDKSKHLTYLQKEIEWSHRHSLTAVSITVFIYHQYEFIRRAIMSS